MEAAEALKFGIYVARRMGSDPELESIAGEAVARAIATYDGLHDERRWISFCVKRDVWCYWRRMRPRKAERLADDPPAPSATDEPLRVDPKDWQLLVENYLERVPVFAMAKRRGITVYQIRKMLRAAESRLKEAYLAKGTDAEPTPRLDAESQDRWPIVLPHNG